MSRTLSYSVTEYPDLYKDTYWGAFDYALVDEIDETIIQNRNRFANEYCLRSHLNDVGSKYEKDVELNGEASWRLRDHIEYYKTQDKSVVAVFSISGVSQKTTEMAMENGYTEIYPLYLRSATTFVKAIARK